MARPLNVLFLCTGNSARSILAEALLNHVGHGRFHAYSAGSHPKGAVHPFAIETLQASGISTQGLTSKSWEEFARPGAPAMDLIVTVCDAAAGETCPIWPGKPATAHWSLADPAAVQGSDEEKRAAFRQTARMLRGRIDTLVRPEGGMSAFERYLSVWVFACIVAGIVLGKLLPRVFEAVGAMQVARVNIPVGVLIWVMIVPMLMKVDFGALHEVRHHIRGIGVTLTVNWLVKPFSMALLAWLFIRQLFARWLPAEQLDSYVAGLILLAAAPCTAMVFVWSRLSNGDPLFTLSQVALNDTIMVFTFAPIVGLLLGISSITVPWDTLLISVVLYIVLPVAIAQAARKVLLAKGAAALERAIAAISPWSTAALLATLVLLFAFQGESILREPLVIALLAVPILVQVFFNATLAYLANRALGEKHSVACPSALIGASNFFELAVATAISLFGIESGAALATVVGVLIEVPVMLLVVRVVNSTRDWYAGATA